MLKVSLEIKSFKETNEFKICWTVKRFCFMTSFDSVIFWENPIVFFSYIGKANLITIWSLLHHSPSDISSLCGAFILLIFLVKFIFKKKEKKKLIVRKTPFKNSISWLGSWGWLKLWEGLFVWDSFGSTGMLFGRAIKWKTCPFSTLI